MANKYGEMNFEELMLEESQLRTALFNLRVENTTKALEDISKIRQTKRELARCLTAISALDKSGQASGGSTAVAESEPEPENKATEASNEDSDKE